MYYASTIEYAIQKKGRRRALKERTTSAVVMKNYINARRIFAPGIAGAGVACSSPGPLAPMQVFAHLLYLVVRSCAVCPVICRTH